MPTPTLTLADIRAAAQRIAPGVAVTPCPESVPLSEITGCRVYCKLDYLQRTGSFKERGARNALELLPADQRTRGVIAASAGNHALALAYHGMLLGIPVTVVMPTYAPLVKLSTCRHLRANVILQGNSFDEALAAARDIAARQHLTYIHGYDAPAIIAGQGTLGLEILNQVPNVDAVIVPVGGAGLIAGVALAIKSVNPRVQVIGVEAENAACFAAALEAGKPVTFATKPTLADGLAVNRAGDLAFAIARKHVDRNVLVNEDALALAILRLLEMEKGVVEGAGAAPLAALLAGKLPELAGKRVVLVLAGGNIDPSVLSKVIERGLVADGRICHFTATISDRPGGLARFTSLVASTGASIKEVIHDRAFCGSDVYAVNVLCIAETRDRQHIADLAATLRNANIPTTGI